MSQRVSLIFNWSITILIALYLLYMFFVAESFPWVGMIVLMVALSTLVGLQYRFFNKSSTRVGLMPKLLTSFRKGALQSVIIVSLIGLYSYVMQAGIQWTTLLSILIGALIAEFLLSILKSRA